jgi:hypothetical protein
MITCWLMAEGGWKSLTANERIPRKGGSRRLLSSRQVSRWWRNELALIAAPCFDLTDYNGAKAKTFFTIFSINDRMHRPQ